VNPSTTSALSPHPATGAGARRILIVDDDADLSEEVVALLSGEGFITEVARDGGQAIARLREGMRPDLILLDLMMPVVDGWQFRAFQLADPDLASLPVIAMSASGTAQARAIHADAYIDKPFNLSELLRPCIGSCSRNNASGCSSACARLSSTWFWEPWPRGSGIEINNPLTYILGGLDELEQELPTGTPDRSRRLLSEIRYGVRRIQSVVSGLRACTIRPEEPAEIHLGRLIEGSLAIAAHVIRPRAHVRMAIEAAPVIVGSEARLSQVLINLLVNAAQSFEGGTPDTNEIRVHARAAGDKAIIEVSDNGPGHSRGDPRQGFRAFRDQQAARRGDGTRPHRLERHRARAWRSLQAEDSALGGTTFRLVLPVRRRQ
jgi:CheY-like chemotaxis protein